VGLPFPYKPCAGAYFKIAKNLSFFEMRSGLVDAVEKTAKKQATAQPPIFEKCQASKRAINPAATHKS
jgi:hypothetical protein